MTTLTNEQIEQKKQLLAEKMNEMKAIHDELVEAGALSLSDEDLEKVAGGDWRGKPTWKWTIGDLIEYTKLQHLKNLEAIKKYKERIGDHKRK